MQESAINYARERDGKLANTYLIQRLNRPFKSENVLDEVVSAFAFGGGLRNGGLTKDAMNLLQDIFRFDYMGAAEFEWGAVPSALQYIAKNVDKYIAYSFGIPKSKIAKDFRDESRKADHTIVNVFVILQKGDEAEYQKRIEKWANKSYNDDLKESTRLSSTLRPYSEWDGEVQGWLDLNNGVMFFTDEEMWKKTCDLFGIKANY